MERNRVSALQAIVAIVVVGLIAVIFLLPVLGRFGPNEPVDVTVNSAPTVAPVVITPASPTLAPPIVLPTATPALPTAIPSPTTSPTSIPVVEAAAAAPTPVPTLPPLAPTAAVSNTNPVTQAAIVPAEPTAANAAIATVAPVATTSPTVTADFRFGYIDDSVTCPMATKLVQGILTERLALQVELVHFVNKDELFAALASDNADKVDLTFCYTDPGDRHYLQEHVGFVLLLGGAYHHADSHEGQLQVLTNAQSKARIQNTSPCFYKLLRAFELGPEEDHALAVADWLVKHNDMVQLNCGCNANRGFLPLFSNIEKSALIQN
jgi:hypothetical protein